MTDISVGAVGAAIIAGLVSLFGLIIGKEQKISEFRQIWIDELRKSIVTYLVNVNSISDLIRIRNLDKTIDNSSLIASYKSLNEASYSIKLRINPEEKPAKKLLRSMLQLESLFKNNRDITPDNIRDVQDKMIVHAQKLLKFEWNRVKKGEYTFVWTKRIIIFSIFFLLIVLTVSGFYKNGASANAPTQIQDNFSIGRMVGSFF